MTLHVSKLLAEIDAEPTYTFEADQPYGDIANPQQTVIPQWRSEV
jgi:hypothetical protein